MAIAERPSDQTGRLPELRPAPPALGLPPGGVPVDAVRSAIRRYRAGIGTADQLIAVVDRHGDALEREIHRKVTQHRAEFLRCVHRLERLHAYVATAVAQARWLTQFPGAPAVDPVPVGCRLPSGQVVAIPVLLEALLGIELDPRLIGDGDGAGWRAHDGRRGASASMAAIADAGVSTTDLALELGVERSQAWQILNGHQPAPAGLRDALQNLTDDPAPIIAAIPRWSDRAPASPAVTALHDAGGSTEDLAEIMRALPSTVRKQLRGALPPSPKLAPALEQLLGERAAASVLEMIPSRNGGRGSVRKEVRAARIAIGSLLKYAENPAALTATPSDVERWRRLAALAADVLAAAQES